MPADHDSGVGQQPTHRAGQPFHGPRFVAVGGETHQLGSKAGQRAFEGGVGEAVQPQVEHPHVVLLGNRGGQIAELQGFQALKALEAEHGSQVSLGLDEQDAHRSSSKCGSTTQNITESRAVLSG